FSLRDDQRLIDLPGYGFAKVPARTRAHWRELIADYFETRRSLRGLFLIMDIRRQITDFDRLMLKFAEQVALPTHVLLTKTDKLKRGQAATALLEVRRGLGDIATVQHFSALTRLGEDEARAKLDEFLALQGPE
ncbi:MAG: YihA family ribosome biogenesis GTP-binding protein, partial [Gammaproteobacteria bacterium]|nr:YihA family ribosome biogenesis GTP-binding protein [Gammaproteobacteria bacterium]